MTIFLLVLGLVLFVGLVIVHEWGHFIMARRNGVEVEEFGVGFPPRAKLLTKKKGTEYTLNWLPLGGFVKLKGEHDSDTEKGTFGAASLFAKTKIMLAGVVMNLVTALVLLTILALAGMPVLITKNTIGESQFTVASDQRIIKQSVVIRNVEAESPAAKAGIQNSDRLVSVTDSSNNTVVVKQMTDFQEATKNLAGQNVQISYIRDGEQKSATAQLRSSQEVNESLNTDKPKGYLGVVLGDIQVNRYTWSAPVVAAGVTAQITKLTLQGLGNAVAGLGKLLAGLFTGNTPARQAGQVQATEQVSGPLGIVYILKAGASEGIGMILFIVALISLTLAIMNVLPIPALDGGRLFVTLVFRTLKIPLTQTIEERIHGTGFAALMLLFLLITVVDIKRFF